MASRSIWQSPLFFLVIWSLSTVIYQSLGGMWSSIITTVEEVFHLTSFQSGTLTIVDYFAGLWISLPLVYYGQHQHRPRFIGAVTILTAVGAFIQAFPHLLYRIPVDELINRNNGGPNVEVCNRSNAIENDEDRAKECDVPEQEHSFFFGPCIWFFIGRIITSCYGAVYPIALVYLDDGVPKRSIVLYAGFITTIYAIGFTSGYFVASAVLSLPLYLTGLDEDVDRSKLPGAWWLGYVVLSSLVFLTAIPFFWFPASLPPQDEETEGEPLLNDGESTAEPFVQEKEESQGFFASLPSLSEVTSSTKDFFKSLWRVVTNPIIFLMAISGGIFILGSETLATFSPLYAQEYYRLSPSQAAVLTGIQALFGYIIGQLLGAVLLRYLDLNRLQCAVFYTEHRIESIDERMESSREFNFNAAFLELSRNKFVASPSVEELDSLKKSEIVKVAKHYGIEFQPLMRKDEIKRYVLEYLVDEGVLPSTVLETAITVPTDNTFELKRLELEMNKEIRLKEMEREMQKEKEEREMQKEKEEREMQMQREKEEREERERREEKAREHEFRLKQLELGVIKGSDPKIGLDTGGFDVSKHVKFVPKFQEDNVEKFFNHFEKLGEQLKWPRDKWSILIQSNFTGKAQEVYSALSIEDSMDYDKVKKAILQAYELVPEAYRQKFRKYRKADTQTYVEFAYQKERHFDRWCASKKVSTFDTLRQLMLVEEFKRCVNDDIKTHLEENKADKLSEVANLADQYALTHKFGKVGQTQNKGNDLAGGKVVANAILTDKPCDYNNTEQLEKEFPNLFPACAVTRAMSQKLAVDDNLKHPPSKSEDTVPKSGTSRESCKDDNLEHPLSKNEGMISENKDDKLNHPPSKIEELVPKNGITLPKEESESGKDSSKNIHESEDSWYDLSQSFMTNLDDSQDYRLHGACELAQENLRHSQKKMKAWYDKTTVKREFKPGDKVLVFLPVSGQPLQARFQGPYVIERKVSDTDYIILTPDKRKSKRVCHINVMKRYYEREDCDISKDESVHDELCFVQHLPSGM
ncbi:Solute carrier organic anion transporter family member 2B1 [Holothuria leucospilota]|uniref:Solute carrier organic anion transporter family member 2B1 n=1 Tax=Holothuria leucospilota TaxID=206669 RepID=A0A9Q1CGI5_HOLLE|nr:Solute carrier organic anion transporter family member 2B1 [Holothuria leucospilota]